MPGGHAISTKMHGFTRQRDPGASGSIKVRMNPCVVELISAAAESRTLANPSRSGVNLTIAFRSDGGDVTLTVTNGYDEDGNTVITFNDSGQYAAFISYYDGTNYRWRLIATNAVRTAADYVAIPDGNYTILAANSGRTHVVADVTADRTYSFPAEVKGLDYLFIPDLNAADDFDWIFDTGSDTNFFTGGLAFLDTDAGAGADELSLVVPDGNSNSKLQVNLPQPGTWVRFICNGTTWNISGQVFSTTAPTFADQ